jgi:hypothetical protein
LLSWTYSLSESLAWRLKSRATSTKHALEHSEGSPFGDYPNDIVCAGGLRLRSPRIYSPGGLAIAYDAYIDHVHSLPGEASEE